jgi:SAM-dependent methyltransferase
VTALMADHVLFAAAYDRLMAPSEAAGLAGRRRQLLALARGRVLEIGAGTGLNLAHYPADAVDSVVVLEPDGAMRRRLARRVVSAPVPVEVRAGAIGDLRPEDGPFDTVVGTLVLCTVPDLGAAIRAIEAVLAPDGEFLFLEHVAVPGMRGRAQRLATPVWRQLAAGCHLDRDPVLALTDAGLAVLECSRFDLPATAPWLRPAVRGRARRRAARIAAVDR